jgi:manganese efflux pump family protein
VFPAVLIGVVAGGMSVLGIRLGERVSGGVGRNMEYVGGIVLILIGTRIVIEHTGVM